MVMAYDKMRNDSCKDNDDSIDLVNDDAMLTLCS